MIYRNIFLFAVIGIVLAFFGRAGASVFNEGMIDKDLRYEEFRVTEDGYISGTIINTSKKTRPAVMLDMWITNIAETRIFWRKSITLGDLPPGARFEVRESSNGSVDPTLRLQFMFRLPSKANFRN